MDGNHFSQTLGVSEMISPVAAAWVGHCSRVPEILSKPDKITDQF